MVLFQKTWWKGVKEYSFNLWIERDIVKVWVAVILPPQLTLFSWCALDLALIHQMKCKGPIEQGQERQLHLQEPPFLNIENNISSQSSLYLPLAFISSWMGNKLPLANYFLDSDWVPDPISCPHSTVSMHRTGTKEALLNKAKRKTKANSLKTKTKAF